MEELINSFESEIIRDIFKKLNEEEIYVILELNSQLKDLQRKIDVLTYIIKHLDYLDIWNDYNTSELEEIINGEENE